MTAETGDAGPQLFTSSFQRFRPNMGAPIRTTVGAPRWPLPYRIAGQLEEITPLRTMLGLELDPYRATYRRRLEAVGHERIWARCRALSTELGGADLVLLCFCKVHLGEWCHRRLFADWFTERTGYVIDELPAGVEPDPTLFG